MSLCMDGVAANTTLKQVLYENLLGILSSDSQIRRNAEQQIKLLETNDGNNN